MTKLLKPLAVLQPDDLVQFNAQRATLVHLRNAYSMADRYFHEVFLPEMMARNGLDVAKQYTVTPQTGEVFLDSQSEVRRAVKKKPLRRARKVGKK